jgi:hypothetical protein
MKKKLFSLTLALCLCAAFLIPAYAQEERVTEVISSEIIVPETVISLIGEAAPPTIILPSPPLSFPEPQPEPEKPDNSGVFHIPNMLNTPQGAGTLLEDVSACEVNRQFITVQTRAGNVFYIIIDNDRSGQNVYFLNAVDDFDLLTFSEDFPDGVVEAYEQQKEEILNAQNNEDSSDTEDKPVRPSAPDNSGDSEEEPANNLQLYILIGVGALFLFGLIYFKVIKPKKGGKKQAATAPDEDEEENEESEDF